jgi:hypothetical protein
MLMQSVEAPRPRAFVGVILMAGALLFAGCNILKLGSSPDDRAITTQIQAKLFDDSVLKMRDIHVASDKGTVTLTGTVNTDLEKAAAERVAGRADGVKSVVNQLLVSPVSTVEQPPVAQPAEAAKSAAPQPPAKTAAQTARWKRFRPQRQATTTSESEEPAEQASVPETPADNPPEMAAQAAPPAPAAPPPAPAVPVVKPPEQITVPAGAFLSVRMIESIDSSRNKAGDEFAASVESPVRVGNRVVVPRNSDAKVRLVQASSAGRMSGRSELKVELVSVTADGKTYPLETDYHEKAGASRNTRTAESVGGGAVLGALIGAIAGRGRGAAIGSVAGAGTGAAVEARTHGEQVKIPSETKLDFSLKSPVTVTVGPGTGPQPSDVNPDAEPQAPAASPGGAPLPSQPNPPAATN